MTTPKPKKAAKIAPGKTVMRQMEPMAGTIIRGYPGDIWLVRWKDGRKEWIGEEDIRRMLLE